MITVKEAETKTAEPVFPEDSPPFDEKGLKHFSDMAMQQVLTIYDIIGEKTEGVALNKNQAKTLLRCLQGIKGAARLINYQEILDRGTALEENLKEEISAPSPEILEEILLFVGDIKTFVESRQNQAEAQEKPTDKKHTLPPPSDKKEPIKNHRVKINKINSVMNSIEEIMTLTTKLSALCGLVENSPTLSQWGGQLQGLYSHFEKITEQMYLEMLSIRMSPVKKLFEKFKKVIGELSKEQGKEINVSISGENTEIDRVVLECLKDPLIHLIRNAVDHGVEKPQDRIKAGKPREGNVFLRAFNDINSVIIEIEDTGKGIDHEVLRRKVIEKELVPPETAENMSQQELLDCIFLPGFSTAEKITNISGRGVGMDVVRTNVENLGGKISIYTEIGKGTCFVIRLPLAMSIIDTLLVESGGQTFAVPIESILRIQKSLPESFRTIHNKPVLLFNDNSIPFKRMSEIFELDDGTEFLPQQQETVPTLILRCPNGLFATGIDKIMHKQKIVIKSLGDFLKGVRGISGASIQGDGSIILVVDTSEVGNLFGG